MGGALLRTDAEILLVPVSIGHVPLERGHDGADRATPTVRPTRSDTASDTSAPAPRYPMGRRHT